MSGDVQPRKRKDKRKKKDEEEFVHHSVGGSDEVIHVYKESKLGGNIFAKVVFFGLLGALGLMVGLIIFEYHGTSDVDTASAVDSPWSVMLEGWVDNAPDDHEHGDEHAGGDHDEHEHDDNEHDEHDEHGKENNKRSIIDDEDDDEDEWDRKSKLKEKFKFLLSKKETTLRKESTRILNKNYLTRFHKKYSRKDLEDDDEEFEKKKRKYENEEEEEVEEEDDEEEEEEDEGKDADDEEEEEEEDDEEEAEEEDDEEEAEEEDDEEEAEEEDDEEEAEEEDDEADAEEEEDEVEEDEEEAEEEDEEDAEEEEEEEDEEEEEQEEEDDEGEEEEEAEEEEEEDKEDEDKEEEEDDDEEEAEEEDEEADDDEQQEDDDEDDQKKRKALMKEKQKIKKPSEERSQAALRKKYLYDLMDKLRKEDKIKKKDKSAYMPRKKKVIEEDDDDDDDDDDDAAEEDNEKDKVDGEVEIEDDLLDDDGAPEDIEDEEEDETSGVALKFGVGVALVFVAHVVLIRKWSDDTTPTVEEEVAVSAEVPPTYVERRQTLIPTKIMEDIPSTLRPQDNEYSEGEHDHEEETEEETEDESYVKQTFEELRAAYTQAPVDEGESDIDITEDSAVKSTEYGTTESEPEASEPEEEEEEDELQEDEPVPQWKSESGPELLAEEVEEVQTGSETEEESEEEAAPATGGPKSAEVEEEQESRDFVDDSIPEPVVNTNEPEKPKSEKKDESEEYEKADITNPADWEMKEELDEADRDLDEGNPSSALSKFTALLSTHPLSARALHGKARALDMLAEARRSNSLLEQAIAAYSAALRAANIPDQLLLRVANRTIDRMRFKGLHLKAVEVHNLVIESLPTNITHHIDLAITYLMINRLDKARSVLESALQRWPDDVVCRGYLGLTLKLQGNHEPAVPHLEAAVASDHPLTVNSHFYFHLGDVLQRKGDNHKAIEIYRKGVKKGIFRSEYQRSLYNVDRLKAQPWWSPEQTTYSSFFRKLESNWKIIREEGLKAYSEKKGFMDEAESLRDVGDWKQFELYARGQKYTANCRLTPVTCGLVEETPAARTCRRGQVKFSVMTGGTHVWPHCGPTNCRLRAHLGLVVPPGTGIRVAAETRSWEEGKVLVFDDSFEHEVWHNGTLPRLVLIVDVWHPELTTTERASLNAI